MIRLRFQCLLTIGLCLMFGAAFAQGSPDLSEPLSADEIEELGYRVGSTPSRDLPGYRPLRSMLVMSAPAELEAVLKSVAPEIEFTVTPSSSIEGIPGTSYDAVVLSNFDPRAVALAQNAAWVHTYSAGVDRILAVDWIHEREPIMTNSSGNAAAAIAEHAIALMLTHARQLHRYRDNQLQAAWDRNDTDWGPRQLSGNTVLVLGLGAIGLQFAERAHALGMRVLAVRNSSREGPDYIEYVGLSHEMLALASEADVVMNALPLTPSTRGIIDETFFSAMKPTAIIVNVGRGATIVTDDLIRAIDRGHIAGAGLDVTDPEPLPADHPLWGVPEVVITPHVAGRGSTSGMRFRLVLENLRRYQAGEPLLNSVSIEDGY